MTSSTQGAATGEDLITAEQVFDRVEKMILLADGDRDHGNRSALTCNQSMVALHLLRHLKDLLNDRDSKLEAYRKALEEILAAEKDFREGMPPGWEGDPLTDACEAARRALAAGG